MTKGKTKAGVAEGTRRSPAKRLNEGSNPSTRSKSPPVEVAEHGQVAEEVRPEEMTAQGDKTPLSESSQPPQVTLEDAVMGMYSNMQVIANNQLELAKRLDSIAYAAAEPKPEAPSFSLDAIPEWLREPLKVLMGDLGRAARGLAGDTTERDNLRTEMLKRVIKRKDSEYESRLEAFAERVLAVVDDPLAKIMVDQPLKPVEEVKKK